MMKRFIVAFLLCGVILVGGPAAMAAEVENTVFDYEYIDGSDLPAVSFLNESTWEEDWTSYKDQLTGNALSVYQMFESAFAEDNVPPVELEAKDGTKDTYWWLDRVLTTNTAVVDDPNVWFNTAANEALLAMEAFTLDHPEYFWIRQGFYINGGIIGKTVYANAGFLASPICDTVEERDELQAELTQVINGILEATDGMPQVQKLVYFNSWLAENNVYNDDAAENPDTVHTDDSPWSIVGALLDDHSPVCEGYAKAFQLLCHEIGVPCLEIFGGAFSTDGYGGHMWTAVQLEGEWYFCDPTWGDGTNESCGDPAANEYFLMTHPESHVLEMPLIAPMMSETGYYASWGDCSRDENAVAKVIGVKRNAEGMQAGVTFDDCMKGSSCSVLAVIYESGQMKQLRWANVTVTDEGFLVIDLEEFTSADGTIRIMVMDNDLVPICREYRPVE